MPDHLDTSINIEDADGFYARLIDLHEGLTAAESQKVNAKLILMLANHIGDRAVLDEALDYIQASLARPDDSQA